MFRSIRLVPVLLVACSAGRAPAETPPASGSSPAAASKDGASTAPAAVAPIAADARAEIGKPAPDFTLVDAEGKPHALSEHAGKLVVLEWWNPGCPFVAYAHGEGPLKDMASKEAAAGVVWYAINSGASGKQGAGAEASRAGAATFAMSHPILVDDTGAVGHAYGAEKTPHVYLIDPHGTLVYAGAIDNAPIGEVDGDAPYVNYLAAALADVRAGRPVATPQTKSYGCSVKYAS